MKKNIVDVFPFFNEKELLELRIKTLEDHVDQFVISEANTTHTGIPKPYTLRNIIEELQLPKHKIRILEVDMNTKEANEPSYLDRCHAAKAKSENDAIYWTRERIQRDALSKIVDEYDNDTVFIMSDCDEIIDPVCIQFVTQQARNLWNIIIRIPLRLLESRADLGVYDENDVQVPWEESMFLCMKHHIKQAEITAIKSNKEPNQFTPWPGRYLTQDGQIIQNLGWHFTWMGDLNRKLEKEKSYIHHSNLNVVDNVSNETINLLSKNLNKQIDTGKKYKLKKIDHSLLPSKIFELPNVKNFLLPQE